RASDDAVKEVRIALRHDHRFAATGRTADKIRVLGWPAIVLRDDLLADFGDLADGLVEEVQCRFLVLEETRVEVAALVTRISADDGIALGEGGTIASVLRAGRRVHRTIESTAALEQETAVPAVGQRNRKADGIGLVVAADAFVDGALDAAVRGKGHAR